MSNRPIPTAGGGRPTLEWLLYAPIYLSGLMLAAVMILTAVDVSLRFLDAPIYGTQEITELAMVAVIMLAIPYCTLTKGHVRVDVLDGLLGRQGRWISDLFSAAISMTVLGFLIWNTSRKVADTYRYADVTNLLAIPLWPMYALVAASMAGYVIVVVRDFVNLLSAGSRMADRGKPDE